MVLFRKPVSRQIEPNQEKKTDNSRRPGKPTPQKSLRPDSVCIKWVQPENLFEEYTYQLRYKELDAKKWTSHTEQLTKPSVTLRGLKSKSKFVFQVRMVDDENEGPYSELSDPVETIASAAERLLDNMYDVEDSKYNVQLKKLKVQEIVAARNEKGKTRKFVLGTDTGKSGIEKTILLIGATGTGKSTLVDGMINYILGVKWDDPYRITLVDLADDEKNKIKNQAVSQTQWITCYTIHPQRGGRLDYTLTIIDTPGFGDTRGIQRDKEIVQQIKELFSRDDEAGILFLDAVCFIIKAPDARLTATQLYVFNSIMSLFGQDVKNNFSMLITFADGEKPPVLAALQNADLPYKEYFPFNNSGLFADNSNSSHFGSMFWNMGYHSFEKFFERLATMTSVSLIQTRDVLSQRETIEITIENLIPLIDAGLNKIEQTRIEIAILNEFKTQIECNSDFKYSVTETHQEQEELPSGAHVTNCLTCNITCHYPCYISDDSKRGCAAMGANGNCTQCPRNCSWTAHRNARYKFTYKEVTVEKTYAEKLEKYRKAKGEKMTREKVVARMLDELCELENNIFDMMKTLNECNNILKQIALKPDPLSLTQHIDILIESEKQEKREGFQGRIKSLMECRRRATIDDDINRLKANFDETKKNISTQVDIHAKREGKGIFSKIHAAVQNIRDKITK